MNVLIGMFFMAASGGLTGLADAPVMVDMWAAPDAAVLQVAPQELQEEALMSLPADTEPVAGDCWNCDKSGSTGGCALQSGKVRMQCEGSRADCKKKGCKINGSSSCSSAGNVGKC